MEATFPSDSPFLPGDMESPLLFFRMKLVLIYLFPSLSSIKDTELHDRKGWTLIFSLSLALSTGSPWARVEPAKNCWPNYSFLFWGTQDEGRAFSRGEGGGVPIVPPPCQQTEPPWTLDKDSISADLEWRQCRAAFCLSSSIFRTSWATAPRRKR